MSKNTEEALLQKQIIDYLNYKNIFFYRNNTGAIKSEYNGKIRFFRFGAVGSTDLIAVIAGQYIGIECKGKNGVQSKNQKEFQERLEAAGGIYILAHSLDDIANWPNINLKV